MCRNRDGFTLAEMMVATAILVMVMASAVPTFIVCLRTWTRGSLDVQAAQSSSFALERIIYGVGMQYGLRSAVSTTVNVTTTNSGSWTVTYCDIDGFTNSFSYDGVSDHLTYVNSGSPGGVNIGRNITAAAVTNSLTRGISFVVTCCVTEGRYAATNTMSTSIKWRN